MCQVKAFPCQRDIVATIFASIDCKSVSITIFGIIVSREFTILAHRLNSKTIGLIVGTLANKVVHLACFVLIGEGIKTIVQLLDFPVEQRGNFAHKVAILANLNTHEGIRHAH